jgi:hypothetical protein
VAWDSAYYRDLFHSFDRFVFPPLYSLTLRPIAAVFDFEKNAFEKSTLILNFLSHATIALGLTYYLRRDSRTKDIQPWLPVLLLFFFPWHNVFFAGYSESLFLALTVVAFCFRSNDWLLWASIAAGLSALTRTMGSFLVFALIAEQLFLCVRDRQFYWRKVLLAAPGLLFIAGWHLLLKWRGTNAFKELAPWVDSLVEGSVPPGHSPYVWVLKYLCFNGRWIDVIPFWVAVAAMVYCAIKRRPLELLYIAFFYLSLAIHIYRPFPWSRYVSVLFPVQIMAADFLKNRPRAAAVALGLAIMHSYKIQIELFRLESGEP